MIPVRFFKSRIYLLHLLIAFIILFLSGCGGSSFEKKFHRVTAVVDGNTIQVDNSVYIGLIGIENTAASQNYLTAHLLNQPVRFVYDSGKRDPVTSYNTKIFGYIATITRTSVNAEIIKQRLSNLNEEFLQDSLMVFRSYSGIQRLNDTISPPPPLPPPGGGPLVDLVSRVRPAVFTIYRQNSAGELIGLGTGFFISPDGIGVSNYHVFDGASVLIIKTTDDRQFSVSQIIVRNQESDYILFRVANNGVSLPYLELSQVLPQQGEEIFVIGNPSGLENTVTRGIVSAIREDLIQIDAAISPGSSGSPVSNMNGKVVGIATFKIVEGCELCNFAISADLIKKALNNINN